MALPALRVHHDIVHRKRWRRRAARLWAKRRRRMPAGGAGGDQSLLGPRTARAWRGSGQRARAMAVACERRGGACHLPSGVMRAAATCMGVRRTGEAPCPGGGGAARCSSCDYSPRLACNVTRPPRHAGAAHASTLLRRLMARVATCS